MTKNLNFRILLKAVSGEMKFEAITIKDIAKALGLSTSTVSRALRDSYEISPETKRMVLDYAEKHNYKPNPIALSLKERRSRSIGVIVCEIANSYFSQVINGIESIAYQYGYNVIIAQSRESFDREMMNLQYLTSRSIDGLIISVSTETKDFSYLQQLYEKKLPIVFFDRIIDPIDTHKVTADNFRGAYDATTHLLKSGYRNIGCITNPEILSISKERVAGYKAALQENGITVNDSMIRYCQHGGMIFSEVEDAISGLFDLNEPPDAIFAASDKLTTNSFRILRSRKLIVPEDIGLIGFSNSELTELLDPPLSVVRQPAFEMGEVSTRLLMQLIESKRPVTEFETRVLPTELIVRGSTGKANRLVEQMG
jgi:DNA-binding LacI/PurR family transcriptional regulator